MIDYDAKGYIRPDTISYELSLQEFSQKYEKVKAKADILNVPVNTRFRFIKRIIGKLIRLFALQQMDFNNHALDLIELQRKLINQNRKTIENLIEINEELKIRLYKTLEKPSIKVSVIINTLNRAPWLKKLLDALMLQTYDNFEVIVVNGPSTDNTVEVLEAYKGIIKIENCDKPNISLSRNIGIKAAAGEIIIFIDDDAVPVDNQWIEDYAISFEIDSKLGAIGGKVFNKRGEIEFSCGKIDIWGYPICITESGNCDNIKDVYNYVPGGNGAYLKEAVLKVGGFDEYIEYYADEADLCIRLNRTGYEVKHHPTAHIYHENAGTGETKTTPNKDWYVISKNQTYFAYKNSEGYYDMDTRNTEAKRASERFTDEFDHYYNNGIISQEDYNSFIEMYGRGIKQGKHDGLNTERKINFNLECTKEFLLINKPGVGEEI